MIALDSGVLLAVTDFTHPQHATARDTLRALPPTERLMVSPFAYAELMASPQRDTLSTLLERAGILLLEEMPLSAYRAAGEARGGGEVGRGSLRLSSASFVGAHALHHRARLLTLEGETFTALYPSLPLVGVGQFG